MNELALVHIVQCLHLWFVISLSVPSSGVFLVDFDSVRLCIWFVSFWKVIQVSKFSQLAISPSIENFHRLVALCFCDSQSHIGYVQSIQNECARIARNYGISHERASQIIVHYHSSVRWIQGPAIDLSVLLSSHSSPMWRLIHLLCVDVCPCESINFIVSIDSPFVIFLDLKENSLSRNYLGIFMYPFMDQCLSWSYSSGHNSDNAWRFYSLNYNQHWNQCTMHSSLEASDYQSFIKLHY